MPKKGLGLEPKEKDWKEGPTADMEVSPIGDVKKRGGSITIQLRKEFIPALKELDQFSHVQVLWWFDRFDADRFRTITQCNPPYEKSPRTGIFATRSPVRPNPIGLTTAKVVEVDHKKGTIGVTGFDAFDKTPIIDLKAHFPTCDRVKEVKVPRWIAHWPQWRADDDGLEIVDAEQLKPSDSERLISSHGTDEIGGPSGRKGRRPLKKTGPAAQIRCTIGDHFD